MAKPRWVQEVERTPLISVVAEFVTLEPCNRKDYVYGVCLFHREKTASFSVSIRRNSVHCFGCGETYHDSMGFLTRARGMKRAEAFEWLRNFAQIRREESKKRRWPRKRYRNKKEYLRNKAGRPLW